MNITSKDKNLIIDSLLKKFSLYSIITYDYINDFIKAFENEDEKYDGIDLGIKDYPEDTNPYLFISFKIQSAIYTKLCALAIDDADILLNLVTDKMRVVNMIARRFNITDEKKKEDYLIDALTEYDNSEAIDTFITRYIIAKIKGLPFVTKREEEQKVIKRKEEIEQIQKDKKKQKKKNKQSNLPLTNVTKVTTKEKVLPPESDDKQVVTKEETPYELCLKNCQIAKGSKEKDEFVATFLNLGTYDLIDYSKNKEYAMYMLLRFGLVNETYYSLQEIALICKMELGKVLNFEKYTIEIMRTHLNAKVDYYLKVLTNN